MDDPYYPRERDPQGSGKLEELWNLFVQILLPLLLVLIFVSIFLIINAQYKVTDLTAQLDSLERAVKESVQEKEKFALNVKISEGLIDLQKQKLLNALLEVKEAEKKKYCLYHFPDGDCVIAMEDGAVRDGYFVTMSEKANKDMHEPESYKYRLYDAVLERAGLGDPGVSDVGGRLVDEYTAREKLTANSSTIWKGNKGFILNEIAAFIMKELEPEIIRIQLYAITKTESYVDGNLANYLGRNPRIRKLYEAMRDEKVAQSEYLKLEAEFDNSFYGLIRQKYKGVCPILDDAWRRLSDSAAAGPKKE
jgi:hypothetical protein